ncbi:FAD-dependent thymidylate synthase [Terriglobus aquaticus]|uniref:FAD-dependent thymidylate synthase n=1 Tax=Terriglobus aquaticus TaxID=940139 RepID=A0ABW9KJ38_9BACT|nr:FAD-dependent thymidylate synthase [Terriglobus aquaticus]
MPDNLPDVPASGSPAVTAATEVYAIHGADPEVLAYAMAKYSRSALTLRESLKEISAQRAEQFLNTFYFQYGHRSIADLAHVAFAVERLSLLAAIALVDEPRWDGQERSTRYQDFRKSGYYTPRLDDSAKAELYRSTITHLFDSYQAVGEGMLQELKQHTPRPSTMDEAAYTRTLRARAFDMARYLLPLATNTSLGQITNARTLEQQIARLLGSEYGEIRELGERLREAASGSAWNPTGDTREVKVAPTLVKYTAPSNFAAQSKLALTEAARSLMGDAPIAAMPAESPNVELIVTPPGERLSLEIDLATSLLYPHTHYRYAQLREAVRSLPEQRILELVSLGTVHRGRHDELPRAFAAANGLRFDILMDVGGFRDMHRHRRCVQLLQDYTSAHGFDTPDFPGQPPVSGSAVAAVFAEGMESAMHAYARLGGATVPDTVATASAEGSKLQAHSAAAVPVPEFRANGSLGMTWGKPLASPADGLDFPTDPKPTTVAANPDAAYVLPLATRCRSLFAMDFAQAVYISELRSTPAGHWSYRNVAWQMFQAVQRQYPGLAEHFRIRDPHEPVDLLQR